MNPTFIPPRHIEIGDAAWFAGTTPEAIHRYDEIGLLPEAEQGSDGRRRYGYEDMIRLLWIHKMVDAGLPSDDIRAVFADTAPAGADSGHDGDVVQRLQTVEGRMGLLSDFVTDRLKSLPKGFLRQGDLDGLLVLERIFGPLGAAGGAIRYIALATHPGLREESDRVDAAEEALDDTVALDDPRVAQVAAERNAFERKLETVMEEDSELAQSGQALMDAWDALHPAADAEGEDHAGQDSCTRQGSMSLGEVVNKMPYDYSPARLRCLELGQELLYRDAAAH